MQRDLKQLTAFEFVNSLPNPETLTTKLKTFHLSHRMKVPILRYFRSSVDFIQVQRVLREAQVHLGRVGDVGCRFSALLPPTAVPR